MMRFLIVLLLLLAINELYAQSDPSDKKDRINSIICGTKDELEVLKDELGYTYHNLNGNRIYHMADKDPEFPGGYSALMKYIQQNLEFPPGTIETEIKSKIYMRFIVNEDGSISHVRVIRSMEPSLDEEAKGLIESMPKWIPGKIGGKAVASYFDMPVIVCFE